ncbi:MAG: hypothetical protein ACJ789_12770 [Thermomicrobiales bacterium]
MGTGRARRLLAVAMMFLLLAVGTMDRVAAQGTFASSVDFELHNLVCPADTFQIFETCHEDRLGGVTFSVANGAPITDENGVFTGTIGFDGTSTTLTIIEDPNVAFTYVGAYLYCRDLNTNTVLFDGRLATNGADVTITNGQSIVCDWYNLTAATGGPTGSPAAPGPAAPVSALPSTGSGSSREADQRPLWVLLLVVVVGTGFGLTGLRVRRHS